MTTGSVEARYPGAPCIVAVHVVKIRRVGREDGLVMTRRARSLLDFAPLKR
jgi:hypothetical protein